MTDQDSTPADPSPPPTGVGDGSPSVADSVEVAAGDAGVAGTGAGGGAAGEPVVSDVAPIAGDADASGSVGRRSAATSSDLDVSEVSDATVVDEASDDESDDVLPVGESSPELPDPTGGYQVCIHLGSPPEVLSAAGLRMVELRVTEPTSEAVLEALAESPLAAPDFRSEALFTIAADVSRDVAVMTYAALLGFAGRRVDVTVADVIVDASEVDQLARSIPCSPAPDPVPFQVQVGSVAHPVLPSVLFSSAITPQEAAAVHFARRLRFAPAADAAAALTQLLVVAGMRARGDVDRLPYLVDGDEPFDADEPLAVAGVCLDTLKSAANALRRGRYAGNRSCVVERVAVDERRDHLTRAASLPVDVALVWLGGRLNADTGLWHCPRPERHNNGDANASMRVTRGRVRCFRCDGERVDALRLAMDVRGLSPDDAADWLLEAAVTDGVPVPADHPDVDVSSPEMPADRPAAGDEVLVGSSDAASSAVPSPPAAGVSSDDAEALDAVFGSPPS